jgi:hypothetical protein
MVADPGADLQEFFLRNPPQDPQDAVPGRTVDPCLFGGLVAQRAGMVGFDRHLSVFGHALSDCRALAACKRKASSAGEPRCPDEDAVMFNSACQLNLLPAGHGRLAAVPMYRSWSPASAGRTRPPGCPRSSRTAGRSPLARWLCRNSLPEEVRRPRRRGCPR